MDEGWSRCPFPEASGHSVRPGKECPPLGGASEPHVITQPSSIQYFPWGLPSSGLWGLQWYGRKNTGLVWEFWGQVLAVLSPVDFLAVSLGPEPNTELVNKCSPGRVKWTQTRQPDSSVFKSQLCLYFQCFMKVTSNIWFKTLWRQGLHLIHPCIPSI